MRSGTAQSTRWAIRIGGVAAFLLAVGMLGTSAPAQDAAKPVPKKDQPKAAEPKDAAPKKVDAKPAPAKLGLWVNDPRALQGYTLMSPFVSPNTYLVDMQGRVVHTWKTDSSVALSAMLLENGHLLRPGSIGGDANIFGPGPGVGGRIQEFTWEGELVWDFKFYNARQLPHHDLTRLPNGNVLLIVWDRKTTEEAIAAGRRPEMAGDKHMLPDSLVEIKPTGKTTGEVVWEWHLWDHLVQDFDKTKMNFGDVAMHPELVNINYGEDELPSVIAAKDKATDGKGKPKDGKEKADIAKGATPAPDRPFRADPDYTHMNGVAYNADLDQISMSVWRFSEFWIIDHSTTTAEAAGHKGGRHGKGGDLLYRYGNPRAYRAGTKADRKLFSQHNAHWIPKGLAGAGHILVFNNGPERPGGNSSSVDELELPVDAHGHYLKKPGTAFGPEQPVWSYAAPRKADFFSSFISGAQRLANGNTLICSGANGTVFEVTPEKEIVWKYINPVKGGTPFGPPPQLGQIMKPVAMDMLAISSQQRLHLDELQKDIDAHLDKLLTAEQKKQAGERTGGGGYGPNSQPGQVMNVPEQNRLKLTDDQKKDVTALQKAVDARFDKVLTEAQKKQLKSVFTGGPVQINPGAGNADGPQPGKILSAGQQDTLKLSAEQRKRMAEIQKEIDARLETLLTADQQKQLQAMRQRPPVVTAAVAVNPGGAAPGGN
ncbi:MAG TPA: aryl-sulfate sulfotransferase, partial [Gemmataceae bacterium]|nr:aryl-sulfate sulfotransferase [Gemmataceae bacterium]